MRARPDAFMKPPASAPALSFEDLIGWHRSGFKPKDQWGIGLEVEKIAVDAATSLPIPYEGERASVRSIVEFIATALLIFFVSKERTSLKAVA